MLGSRRPTARQGKSAWQKERSSSMLDSHWYRVQGVRLVGRSSSALLLLWLSRPTQSAVRLLLVLLLPPHPSTQSPFTHWLSVLSQRSSSSVCDWASPFLFLVSISRLCHLSRGGWGWIWFSSISGGCYRREDQPEDGFCRVVSIPNPVDFTMLPQSRKLRHWQRRDRHYT